MISRSRSLSGRACPRAHEPNKTIFAGEPTDNIRRTASRSNSSETDGIAAICFIGYSRDNGRMG